MGQKVMHFMLSKSNATQNKEDYTLDKELVIVLDFGGQYNQLVARRVRECNVYCEIYSYKTELSKIKEMNPKGIV